MNYKEGYDWGKQSLETAGVSEAELDLSLIHISAERISSL